MNKYAFALVLVVGLACGSAQAQTFVERDFWSLDLKPLKFDKVRPGGPSSPIYYWFLYQVTNTGKTPRKVKLNIFAIINLVRAGKSKDDVMAFDSFIKFKLPETPDDGEKEFDNMPKLALLKRYYDGKNSSVMDVVQRKITSFGYKGGPFKHTSEIGTLAPGASVKAVAIFKGIDRDMDYTGIIIKGLKNRIQVKSDKPFIEDEVMIVKYHSPGDATNAYENPIWYRGKAWIVTRRTRIRIPREP